MNRRALLKYLAAIAPGFALSKYAGASFINTKETDVFSKKPFQPTWDSLMQYKTPNWFQNAKFGIWAHWGPQCQPEAGDWYARKMYVEGSDKYKFHVEKYGHPSKFGFKDIIHQWKAEEWNPDELVGLYKRAGAKYFMALANHHDNFDLYNSKYHTWNSTKIGPKKDIVAGWKKAAKKHGLHFAVSVHAAHAWSWFETSQRADKAGSLQNQLYDGILTKNDGIGKWWEGLDPQDLYAQNHPLSLDSWDDKKIHQQWDWGNGVSVPSEAYCQQFYKRTIDLIDQYNPDMLYFDDSQLPLWPISDVGLKIAAHFYNKSYQKHGSTQVVINGKILNEQQRQCMVWDIERGQSNSIEPLPWQTDTCIGDWHYNRSVYDKKRYKSAKTVIHTLVDVVSKNGNLMLSVPVRGNGTIDELERKIVEEIGNWMQLNSESIYDTRPWKIFGEGPALEKVASLNAQGFNEGKGKPFTAQDIRFVVKNEVLYATNFGWPDNNQLLIKSVSTKLHKPIQQVQLLSTKQILSFKHTENGLLIDLTENKPMQEFANVFKITAI